MPSAAAIIAFDIETIPDIEGLRRLNTLPSDISDGEVVEISARLRRQEKKSDFFPLHLQRVAAISCVLRRFDPTADKQFNIFSLPFKNPADESEAIMQFYQLLNKYQPLLASWNGGGFDLPVLHYRAMIHRLQAPAYWKNDGDYKWDSYTNRYHERHTDLMDVLAMFQTRSYAPLNDFSILCGLPGKIGIGGDKVWSTWQQGKIDSIRRYCEHDALLTYLLYVRYQHFRGRLNGDEEYDYVRRQLQQEPERWEEFLNSWHIGGGDSKLQLL